MLFREFKKINKENFNFLISFCEKKDNIFLAKELKKTKIFLLKDEHKIDKFLQQTLLYSQLLINGLQHDFFSILQMSQKQNKYKIKENFINNQLDFSKTAESNLFRFNLQTKEKLILLSKDTEKLFKDELLGSEFSFFHEMSHLILLHMFEKNDSLVSIKPFIYKTILQSQKIINKSPEKYKINIESIFETYADLMAIYLMNEKRPERLNMLTHELIENRIYNEIKYNDFEHNSSQAIESSLNKDLFKLNFLEASQVFFMESIQNFYKKVHHELKNNDIIKLAFNNVIEIEKISIEPMSLSIYETLLDFYGSNSQKTYKNSSSLHTISLNDFISHLTDEMTYFENNVKKISQYLKKEVKFKIN